MADIARITSETPTIAPGMRVLVIGLGRCGGGVGVTRWLAARGARVTVTDLADAASLDASVAAIADLDVAFHLGGHDMRDLDDADLVVVNPAVDKRRSSFFHAVRRKGVPWTTEINLFCARCPGIVIGVTGTYGKSTTCAMLAMVLRRWVDTGRAPWGAAHLGGNIGVSLLAALPGIRPGDPVVLELSNAQLEDLPRIQWAPPIAVVTNVSAHHLDRHGSFAAYADAKLNIARDPRQHSTIIVGDVHADFAAMLRRDVDDRRIIPVPRDMPPIELDLCGRHNRANAACALTVCRHLGIDETWARHVLRGFPGLPHRLEDVGDVCGIRYCNDSKATTPTATVTALDALNRPVVAIVGGQDRGASVDACVAALAASCRAVVCVGSFGGRVADALNRRAGAPPGRAASRTGAARSDGTSAFAGASERPCPRVAVATDWADAVQRASAVAQTGDVVLLSPGAPSFDAYDNFAQRGRHFVELVRRLG